MPRDRLINFRGLLFTKDTAEAIQTLERNAVANGWQLVLLGPQAKDVGCDPMSLAPAGREVWVTLMNAQGSDPQSTLNAVWGHAIPLGFTPWNRYPLPGDKDAVFHFLGPWRPLYDRLLSEGRGHLAWPSVCCAAQCDVGQWQGDKSDERYVQAQLHRIGKNCGPVDGVIGPRTAEAIRSLGLERSSFAQVLAHLTQAGTLAPKSADRRIGHITLPGRNIAIASTDGIKVVRTQNGATLTVDQPGRVVLDIGEAL